MEKRTLGKSGIEVSPLAFGGNIFGWTVNEARSFELLDAFVAAGFNLIDTADVYSSWASGNVGGESESIIGNWLKKYGKRDKVVIATKVGNPMGEKKGLSPAYIREAVDASLRRLQTDYIDLYQAHIDDKATPLADTLGAFAELIDEGKVRAIGASNYTAKRLAEALSVSKKQGLPRYQTLQPLYNLYDRAGFERELESLALAEGLGVINYYSLASGFLTGKYRTEADFGKSARGIGMNKYLNDRGRGILTALDKVSASSGSTPARVAIAWLLARPSITAPIASATTLGQLNDLVEATKLNLSADAISLLNKASAE
jgi:aryl-alcohol dehydrogenase-like predicted oxidoreductase